MTVGRTGHCFALRLQQCITQYRSGIGDGHGAPHDQPWATPKQQQSRWSFCFQRLLNRLGFYFILGQESCQSSPWSGNRGDCLTPGSAASQPTSSESQRKHYLGHRTNSNSYFSKKKLADLITAVAQNKEVNRRQNAVGALKDLASKRHSNRKSLALTMWVLPALTSILMEKPSDHNDNTGSLFWIAPVW